MAQNDIQDLAQGLIASEPFMVIGRTIANAGQDVQDAWDTVKSHLQSVASKAVQPAQAAATPTVLAPAVASAPAPKSGTYRIKMSDGREFNVTTDGAPPTEGDVMAYLAHNPSLGADTEKAPGSGLGTMASAFQAVKDFGVGAVKGAAHTAIDLGQAVHAIPGVSSAVDALYGQPGLSQASFPAAREATAYSNPTQTMGGMAETIGEMAVPVGEAAAAIPTTAKAGAAFQQVMGAAKNIPVDVNAPGQVALRIQQLAERGASMPMVVRKFLGRVTDPAQGELTYQEARDFASNISRLSADEYGRLTPVVGREVANLRVTLNKAVADAASKVGQGATYAKAMTDYARAMRIRGVFDDVLSGAKHALPFAGAAGAGAYIANKIADWTGQ